jgi:hypothetical protein
MRKGNVAERRVVRRSHSGNRGNLGARALLLGNRLPVGSTGEGGVWQTCVRTLEKRRDVLREWESA